MLDRRPVVTHHLAAQAWGFRLRLAWSWLPTLHHRHHGNPLKDCQHHFYSLAHCKGAILFPSHSCFGRLSISIIKRRLYESELCSAHSCLACVCVCVSAGGTWTAHAPLRSTACGMLLWIHYKYQKSKEPIGGCNERWAGSSPRSVPSESRMWGFYIVTRGHTTAIPPCTTPLCLCSTHILFFNCKLAAFLVQTFWHKCSLYHRKAFKE